MQCSPVYIIPHQGSVRGSGGLELRQASAIQIRQYAIGNDVPWKAAER
jgi:hypothetical protein